MSFVSLRRLALMGATVVLAGVPLGTPAQASTRVGFELSAPGAHAYPKLTARPGQTVRGAVVLRSRSSRAQTVRLQALDLVTANSGGIDFKAGRARATGAWLRLARTDVRLAARGTASIGFTARIPAGARAGEHFAGIVAMDRRELRRSISTPTGKRRGLVLRRLTRLALPVRFRLPGRSERRLELKGAAFDADAGGSRLDLDLRSSGQLLVRGTRVDLEVSRDGKRLFRHTDELSEFVPATRIGYPVPFRGAPVQGDYRVTGTIRPRGAPAIRVDLPVAFEAKQSKRLEQQTGEVAAGGGTPPLLIAGLVAAVALSAAASLGYLRLRRRLARATRRDDGIPAT